VLSLSIFVAVILIVFFLSPLAISPMRFGRPGDWPVSLKGQGELARAGLQNGRIYCEGVDKRSGLSAWSFNFVGRSVNNVPGVSCWNWGVVRSESQSGALRLRYCGGWHVLGAS
jgi:hypothetical protein